MLENLKSDADAVDCAKLRINGSVCIVYVW